MSQEDTKTRAEIIIKKYAPEGQNWMNASEINSFIKDFLKDLKVCVNPLKTQHNKQAALLEISEDSTLNPLDFQKVINKYFGSVEQKNVHKKDKTAVVKQKLEIEGGQNAYFSEGQKHMFKTKNANKSNTLNSKNIFSEQASGMSRERQQQNQQKFKLRDPNTIGIREGPKFKQALAQAEAKGRKFLDVDFPPTFETITKYGDWYDDEIPGEDWIRPEEHFKQGYDLFEDGIVPGDIQQDKFGDCYLLSTLATLAEWPERIQRIFTSSKKNQWGVYSLWIVFNGLWEEVLVDDNLWYNKFDREFVSMSSNGNEIWPQLAEKAYAKLHGDYFAIDGGVARDSLQAFTGAPVAHFRITEDFLWKQVKDKLFNYFILGEKYNLAMCAGTKGMDDDNNEVTDSDTIDGMYYGHSYSILAAYEITVDGEKVKLLKFRNPHGSGEYNGKFRDSDPIWKKVSQEDKDMIEFTQGDDGVFFLEFNQLRKYFDDVQICSYRDNYIYEAVNVETGAGEQENFFEVTVPESSEPGFYYFQLNQIARACKVYDDEDEEYRYQKATINVVSENNDWIVGVHGCQKNVSSYTYQQEPKPLQAGKYYVLTKLKIGAIQQKLNIKSYAFGVYGKEQVQIKPVSAADIGDFAATLRNVPYKLREELIPFDI